MTYAESYGKSLRGREKGLMSNDMPRKSAKAFGGFLPMNNPNEPYTYWERQQMFKPGGGLKRVGKMASNKDSRNIFPVEGEVELKKGKPINRYGSSKNFNINAEVRENDYDRIARSEALTEALYGYYNPNAKPYEPDIPSQWMTRMK